MTLNDLVIQMRFDSARFQESIDKLQQQFDNLRRQVEETARNMSERIDETNESVENLGKSVEETGKQAEEMGNAIGDAFGNIAQGLIGPVVGMLSFKAIFSSFISDVEKAAEETGIYNKELEEERKKKELLQRITKEDMELFAKFKYSLSSFQYAVQSVAAAFDRTFSPAVERLIQWLDKVTNWVRANENNIVRFLKVVASIIAVALIPAFIRLAAVLWANPLTWVIALIGILALVIDDLIVYIQGGESELDWFWSKFGTGEEIAERLKKAWEDVVAVWDKVGKQILIFIGMLVGFKIIGALIGLIGKLGSTIQYVFALLTKNPFLLLIAAIADLIVYIITGKSLLDSFWSQFGTGEEILAKLKAAWDGLASVFNKIKGIIPALIAAFLTFNILKGVIAGVKCLAVAFNLLKAALVANPFILIASLIAGAVYLIIENWGSIKELFQHLGDWVIGILDTITCGLSKFGNYISNIFSNAWNTLLNIAKNIGNAIVNTISAVWNWIVNLFKNFGKSVANIFLNLWNSLVNLVSSIGSGIVNAAKGIWDSISNTVSAFGSAIAGFFSGIWNGLKNTVKSIGSGIASAASNIWDSIVDTVSSFGSSISSFFSDIWNGLTSTVSSIGSSIVSTASSIWDGIVSGVSSFGSTVSGFFSGIWNGLTNTVSSATSGIVSAASNIWNSVVTGVTSFGSNIMNSVSNIWKDVKNFFDGLDLIESGKKLISSFIDGIKAKANALIDSVKDIFKTVREYLPFSDAHRGPFSQLTLSGKRFVTTFSEGADQQKEGLIGTVEDILSGVTEALTGWESPELKPVEQPIIKRDQPTTAPETNQKALLQRQVVSASQKPAIAKQTQPTATPQPQKKPRFDQILSQPSTVKVDLKNVTQAKFDANLSKREAPKRDQSTPILVAINRGLANLSSSIKTGFSETKLKKVDNFKDSFSEVVQVIASNIAKIPNPALNVNLPTVQAVPTNAQLMLASIPEQIKNNSVQRTTNTSVTTSIGEVVINTQATDSKGIANSISKDLEARLSHAGTAASLSGVRQ